MCPNLYSNCVCACVCARARARALVPSYFHPAYSACFTRANLSKPHCEGIWGPHAAWPAFACVFLCVFGSARAPVCTWGLMFTQTDGGAHLFLSSGSPKANRKMSRDRKMPTDARMCESCLLSLRAADQPVSALKLSPCGFKGVGVEWRTFPSKNGIVVCCVTLADV